MICTGVQGQSALEFYLSLFSRKGTADCRGPVIYLELSKDIAAKIFASLTIVDKVELVENAYISRMLNRPKALFGSCAGHWLDMSVICSAVGFKLEREDLQLIGDGLKSNVCTAAEWDFKELDNYLRNIVRVSE